MRRFIQRRSLRWPLAKRNTRRALPRSVLMMVMVPFLGGVGFVASGSPLDQDPAFPRERPITQYTIWLTPEADVTTRSWQPDSNFGGEDTLQLTYSAVDVTRAAFILLRFDLAALPADAMIDSATLELYLTSATGADPIAASAHFVTSAWEEGSVTWNTRPFSEEVGVVAWIDASPGYKAWEVSAFARAWQAGANDGLELRGPIGAEFYERIFESDERAMFRPRLVMTYHLPAPMQVPTETPTASPTPTATVSASPTPTPTPTGAITPCDPKGEEREVLVDFEGFTVGEVLNGVAVGNVVNFAGDGRLTIVDPTVATHSESRALMNRLRPDAEQEATNLPIRIHFATLQDFVGVYVGLDQNLEIAGGPFTATLTAFGLDSGGARTVVATDAAALGPKATPVKTCLWVEAAGRIFEATISLDDPTPGHTWGFEVIDDLLIRGPRAPIPLPLDDRAPVVNIIFPAEGEKITTPWVSPEARIIEDRVLQEVQVYVNGQFYQVYREIGFSRISDQEYFFDAALVPEKDLLLYPRTNSIEVRAVDVAGNVGSDRVTFQFVPLPTPTPTPTPSDLHLFRVEFTQAVQCVKDPCILPVQDPFGLPLDMYADKPTLIRLYVRAVGGAAQVPNISGELCWRRAIATAPWTCEPSLNRITVSVTDDPVRDFRGRLDRTLNFTFLPEEAELYQFRISVNPKHVDAEERPDYWPNTVLINMPFRGQRLDVVLWRVEANGLVPSTQDQVLAIAYLLKTYPVSRINLWRPKGGDVIHQNEDLLFYDFNNNGHCVIFVGLWWRAFWSSDPKGVRRLHWYASVDERVPHGDTHGCGIMPPWGAWASGNVNTDFNNNHTAAYAGEIMAQEIGHNYGRDHAPGCGAPNTDPNYPAGRDSDGREGMPILDAWGTDPLTMTLYRPDASYDFMGYCTHKETWVSAYTYFWLGRGILSAYLSPGDYLAQDHRLARPTAQQQEYLVGGVFVTADSATLKQGFYRMPLPPDEEVPPDEGLYTVELRDADGNILITRRFNPWDDSNHPPTETGFTPIIIPWQPGTAQIVILREGRPLLTVPVSPNPPIVTLLSPNGGESWPTTGTQTISWQGSDPDGDALTYTLQYSDDGGQSWYFLAMDLNDTSYEVEAADLAGSGQARIQVWATDGVNTAFDDSDAVFSVEDKGPDVFIASPQDGAVFPTGEQLIFQGFATDLEDGSVEDEGAYVWTSDRDGRLGTGSALWGLPLSRGRHLITFAVTDRDGNQASATASITIEGVEQAPPEGIALPSLLLIFGCGGLVILALAILATVVLYMMLARRRPG